MTSEIARHDCHAEQQGQKSLNLNMFLLPTGLAGLPSVPVHNRWFLSTRFRKPFYCAGPAEQFPRVYELRQNEATHGNTSTSTTADAAFVRELQSIIDSDMKRYGALVIREDAEREMLRRRRWEG